MKRNWIKWAIRILLAPIILFAILILLLYIPPIQNLLRKEAAAYASQATGMDIRVERIDLRFPLNLLVRGVEVVQAPDTLLSLGSLNVSVQALPLFKGRVEVDDITLSKVKVNSSNLIKGMQVRGVLGRFVFRSHGIDLSNESAVVNRAELTDTHLHLTLRDTTETPPDSASAPLRWRVNVKSLKLNNVSFAMQMPADSMRMAAHIGTAELKEALIDLNKGQYGLKQFLLAGASASYDTGDAAPASGFDPAHVAVRDIRLGLDSVLYSGRSMNMVLRECSMNERSGLAITSLTGRVLSNDTLIRVPEFTLQTPNSEISLSGQTYWELIKIPTTGRLGARLTAMIGKQDVLLLAGSLPDAFKEAYPFRPLVIRAGTDGNLKQMQISRFTADLPGAFSLTGGGELLNLTDSLHRSAQLDFNLRTMDLDFLATLAEAFPHGRLTIPGEMNMDAHFRMAGAQYNADLHLTEDKGALSLDADYNSTTQAYRADFTVDSLQLQHFLPKDSIYELSVSVAARGRGIDFTSHKAIASLKATIDQLNYTHYHLSGVELTAELKGALARAHLVSNNALLGMTATGEYNLARNYPDGKLSMDVSHVSLYELRLLPQPLKRPLAFHLEAEARKERVAVALSAGDLRAELSSPSGVNPLMRQSTRFVEVLMRQIKEKLLDHEELRHELPDATFAFEAGQENPLAWYLGTQKVGFHDLSIKVDANDREGINGKASIHELRMDTLQLDTVYFNIRQDSSMMALKGGVINGPKNPQRVFKAGLMGEIRTNDAELTMKYENGKGETGMLLGVNARPNVNEKGESNGLIFRLVPSEPIIAFQKFRFEDHQNWVYLHKNMRVYANVNMIGPKDMGFRVQSIKEDTVSLQNLDVEIRRIRLDELSSVLPYFPEVSGLLSAEAHYIQKEKSLSVSTEATIDELFYERQRIGDITLGATWLPGEQGKQYVNSYLTHDKTEVLVADGALYPTASGKDSIEVNATLEHFPFSIANAFVPDQLVTLSGDMDGELHVTGDTEHPLLNGQLVLDSVSVFARQAGARFTFDNRPVPVKDSRVEFDKFAIFTTSQNPFTIDGYVDLRHLERPIANLTMQAKNYTLINAKRTKESLVYGKVLVDFKSTVRGPFSELVMRGNMNLLSSTDVTYVMTDSPLSVQDRLSGLVTFTSFNDTTTATKQETPAVSLGGLDMLMTVQIDPTVRLKVDLNADRSNRVELEGGGDLSLRYTPQGDLTLAGRYTLSGGLLKYSLPVIPLKDFTINNGSYVEWTGNPMDPVLNFTATERVRSSVGGGNNGASRMVNFDVSIVVKNRLDDLSLAFDITAPEDATVQNQLTAMGAEERNKQAIAMLVTGIYLADAGSTGGLNMGSALNSVLTSQINALAGNLKNASLSVGVEDNNNKETGSSQTDYSFRYSQRFFNDRFQVVLGGKVSTGANATNDAESFIDNISLEYRLDTSGTRYIRLFHNKNYESVLEGEITETGVGLVLRKKLDRLSELFIFKRKKK